MSPILPQYTKLVGQDDRDHEGDRLLADEAETTQPSYPPTAGAQLGEASSSASGAAHAQAPTPFVLPSHLTKYTLEKQTAVCEHSQALCRRGATKEETISLLLSVFPPLASRDPDMIQFKVLIPPASGDAPSSRDYVTVSDAVWDDIMVAGHPSEIVISIVPNEAERKTQRLQSQVNCWFPIILVVLLIVVPYFLISWLSSGGKAEHKVSAHSTGLSRVPLALLPSSSAAAIQ